MNHRVSGSRWHLATLCSYWARPDVTVHERPSGEKAQIGTEVHAVMEHHVRTKLGEDWPEPMFLSPAAEKSGVKLRAWLDDATIPTAVEIAIAYDAASDTARRIETRGHRDYGTIGPMEIPTTLDLLWVKEPRAIIRDLKTGKREHAHREQLLIQALAASRLFGMPTASIGFLFAKQTKCAPDPLEDLTEDDLDAAAWQASSVMRRLPMARPEPGDHCWFCPARDTCPAKRERPYVPPDMPAELQENGT